MRSQFVGQTKCCEDIHHLLLSCLKSSSLWSLVWAKLCPPYTPSTVGEWSALGDHNIEEDFINLAPNLVTTEDNEYLLQPFTEAEAKETAFSIPLDSAAGIDGFSAAFFTHSWNIVGQLLVEAANSSFRSHNQGAFIRGRSIFDNISLT